MLGEFEPAHRDPNAHPFLWISVHAWSLVCDFGYNCEATSPSAWSLKELFPFNQLPASKSHVEA